MTTDQLIAFIKLHGNAAHALPDGRICAQVTFGKDGQTWQEWETVEPTLQAVRDWLEY
jgi:hypothetical protein